MPRTTGPPVILKDWERSSSLNYNHAASRLIQPGSEPQTRGLRIALAGKGGAGRSAFAGTLARTLARRGHFVLTLDVDTLPGLAFSLGLPLDEASRGELPGDLAIEDADKQAKAPIDVAAGSPGIQAFEALVSRLLQPAKPAAAPKLDSRLRFLDKDK